MKYVKIFAMKYYSISLFMFSFLSTSVCFGTTINYLTCNFSTGEKNYYGVLNRSFPDNNIIEIDLREASDRSRKGFSSSLDVRIEVSSDKINFWDLRKDQNSVKLDTKDLSDYHHFQFTDGKTGNIAYCDIVAVSIFGKIPPNPKKILFLMHPSHWKKDSKTQLEDGVLKLIREENFDLVVATIRDYDLTNIFINYKALPETNFVIAHVTTANNPVFPVLYDLNLSDVEEIYLAGGNFYACLGYGARRVITEARHWGKSINVIKTAPYTIFNGDDVFAEDQLISVDTQITEWFSDLPILDRNVR